MRRDPTHHRSADAGCVETGCSSRTGSPAFQCCRQAGAKKHSFTSAAVNNNCAVPAGLDPVKNSIVKEAGEGRWVNIIAVREEDEDKPRIATFVKAYQSDAVKQFIAEKFKGAYIAAG
jgi:ABC-type metal ion transport system substrate-binding protein